MIGENWAFFDQIDFERPYVIALPMKLIGCDGSPVRAGRDVSLSLVSAGANEAIEEYKNKVIDEQLDAIRQIAPDIVIVEV